MLFSLSSHEPFDVPNFQRLEDPYLNSIAYTDSCLGVLVRKIKKSDKWKNTVLIITADHGTIRPDNPPLYDPTNFKIPLLITGGLVQNDTIVNEIVSQSDIPATIAFLANRIKSFSQSSVLTPAGQAFYSYHDGIVYVNRNGAQFYDLVQKRYLNDTIAPPLEKAYFQLGNADFFKP
jgi:phosphoglycerol transferase MdoB-like AlkP superfamily enzyme